MRSNSLNRFIDKCCFAPHIYIAKGRTNSIIRFYLPDCGSTYNGLVPVGLCAMPIHLIVIIIINITKTSIIEYQRLASYNI